MKPTGVDVRRDGTTSAQIPGRPATAASGRPKALTYFRPTGSGAPPVAQIAVELYISIRTVRSHLGRIRDMTGCRRADLTSWPSTPGVVWPPPRARTRPPGTCGVVLPRPPRRRKRG